MKNLLAFLSRYYYWLLFVLLEAVSIVLLFRYNRYQGSVWFSSANVVSGKMMEWQSSVTHYFTLEKTNEELAQQNILLEQQLQKVNQLLMDATKDSTLINKMSMLNGYKTIEAKVVGNSLNDVNNLITIDKGTSDGVKADMGVVSGQGLVGIVYLAGSHYSVIIPAINTQSNISCTIRGRGYFGYLHWQKGNSQEAFVDDVPRHAHFRIGDYIETSGYSSVFPKGITVGKILKTYNSPDGLSYRLKIQLSTDFGNLRDVYVNDNAPMQEQINIIRAAQDSIAARQNQ